MEPIKPSKQQVQKYLKNWDSLESNLLQENALKKLFTTTYLKNEDIDNVLIKVCALNDFYSTNIYSPFIIAKHIIDLKIDKRLENRDIDLVNDIAKVKMPNGKEYKFYSFATKYCSHHHPKDYPIFDSYVEKVLIYFKNKDKFYEFKREDLREYTKYKTILIEFRKFYNIEKFNLKEIDQYLWLAGKDFFPIDYKKKTLT